MTNPISVEVFRDRHSPKVDITPALEGIERVNEFTQGITVTESKVRFPLWMTFKGEIDMRKRDTSKHAADVSVVVSDLPFKPRKNGMIPGGETVFVDGMPGAIAVVSTKAPSTELVTAHELTHALGVSYDTPDDPAHCTEPGCIMNAQMDVLVYKYKKVGGYIREKLERANALQPRFDVVKEMLNNRFCLTCQDKLTLAAFRGISLEQE
jgi:hypothetical protein